MYSQGLLREGCNRKYNDKKENKMKQRISEKTEIIHVLEENMPLHIEYPQRENKLFHEIRLGCYKKVIFKNKANVLEIGNMIVYWFFIAIITNCNKFSG